MTKNLKVLRASLLGGAAFVFMSGAAFAADLGGSLKDVPEAQSDFSIAVTGGATTDYVFRGVSQNDNDPSVNASVTLSYKMFYLGVAGAAVDKLTTSNGGSMEADVIGGIKTSYRGIDFDFGFIYYGYPNQDPTLLNADFLELKASASTKILRDTTVTGTLYWSPDYTNETGATWTVEGSISQPLPFFGLVASATLGHVSSDDDSEAFAGVDGNSGAFSTDNYTYWNAGVSKTFKEHYTFDVRYWGTDISESAAYGYLSGDRVVGSFSFSY